MLYAQESMGQKHRLVMAASLVFAGSALFAQENRKALQAPWNEKGLKEEIVTQRTRTSKHFLQGNKISSFISPSSIHYMDAANSWKEIKTDILTNTGAGQMTHPYAAVENAIKTYFPANPFTGYVTMDSKDGQFKEKVNAIRFRDASNNIISSLPIGPNVNTSVIGNKITYSGFSQGISLVYMLGNDSRKFELVIQSPAFLSLIPSNAKYLSIEEEFVTANGSTLIESPDHQVTINSNDTEVLGFSQPVAFDENTSKETFSPGTMSVGKAGNNYQLGTSFSINWIKSNDRVFPLHLDPTVNYYPQNVALWTGQQTSTTTKTSGYLRLTDNLTTASWCKFDLASLPVGASVTGATFYGYHYTTAGLKVAEIRGLQTVDPVTATGAALFTQSYSGPLYNGNYNFATATLNQWNSAILTTQALTDITAAAGNWIGLGFGYLSGSTTFAYVYGYNAASAANIPYLEVIYFTTPCVGAPGPNTITPTTFSTCAGITNPMLGLATTYSFGGITYQWQMATLSAVGPYTSINGATLSTAPIPTLGVTTWFQAVVTCSAGGTTTLSPSSVIVAGTTTNTVPYFENFESIQAPGRLPNCSWWANNIGNTVQTYTSVQSDNRQPLSGTRYASFGLPSTNNIVYSNGIQMYPGITYSASMYYTTDYLGSSNWASLGLLVGTSQSPTGLVPIASVAPAASGPYKQLSGLFTVPNAGLYYIAVRATGNTGTGLYLSWDDLSVTIPCGPGSPNTPSVTMSANNATVCAGTQLNLNASGADTYTWNTGANGASIIETPVIPGNFIYSVEGTNNLTGCSQTVYQPVTIHPSPIISAFAFPSSVCKGSPTSLFATGADTYLWSNGLSGANIVVTPTVGSNFIVIGTNSLGCQGTTSQQITILPLPLINVSTSQNDACMDDLITLTATGASSYMWSSSSSPISYAGSPIYVTLSTSSIFMVTGTDNNGCQNQASFSQNVSECTGLNSISSNLMGLKAYPNPTSGELTIELNTSSQKNIRLTDVTGRVILNNTFNTDKATLTMANLADGIYYLKITSEDKSEVIKVVKH